MDLYDLKQDIDYMLLMFGKSIIINDNSATALIGYSQNTDIEEIKIITKSLIKRGDLIFYNNQNYLVNDDSTGLKNNAYYKVLAQRCNYSIKFNFSGSVKSFPALSTTKILDIDTSRYMELADGKIQVNLQDNADTKQIALQQRLLSMGYAYQVDGIDRSKVGLIILSCSVTTFTEDDDKDNEIADRWKYEVKHIYTIETTNIDTSLEEGSTLQFVVTVKDNDVVIASPTIIYSADNSNCSVNSTGLITAVTEGTSVITATFTGENGTVKSISITVTVIEPVETPNYTISINGANSINAGYSEIYNVIVKNNGVDVTGQPVTLELLDAAGTNTLSSSIATLSNVTNTSCTINAIESDNYITLKATLNIDTSKTASLVIYLNSGW